MPTFLHPMRLTDALRRDARYAVRVLRRTPIFTLAAMLTLAAAIGVNTAVFSLVHAVLLAPLPYPDPDRLALVSRRVTHEGRHSQDPAVDGRTWELIRDRATSVDRAVFSGWTTGVNLIVRDAGGGERARYVKQQRVGAGFFKVLGVAPQIGRELSADEDRPGGPPAVVLSAALWRSAFNGDPAAVGRTITLRGEAFTVVGIMPSGFQSGVDADLWTPLRPTTTGGGGGENYAVLVRLRPETARAQAEGEIAGVGVILQQERPAPSGVRVGFSLIALQQGLTETLRQPILILWGAVAVVLLAACVNLAGLMLARAAGRTREIATRLALGSSRAAVVRQLLVEAALLGLAGGAGGLLIANAAIRGLAWLAQDTYDIWQPIALGPQAVAVALGLSVIASVIFGLGPALGASRQRSFGAQALAQGGGRSIAGGTRRWPRRGLVVAQVALGVMLLVAAGLLLRTFLHLRGLDPGFDPTRVMAASVSLEDARYRTVDRVMRLADDGLTRLQRAPGIESAALSLGVPYERLLNLGFRQADGAGDARSGMTSATYVTTGFFEALRIPLRRGRSFDARDRTDAAPVVIVNETFARTYFGDAEPLGRRIRLSGTDREIVGIVGDVQVKPGFGDHGPLSAMPLAYLPLAQVSDAMARLVHGWFLPTFVVRSSLPAAQTAATIRDALQAADPLLPLAALRAMDEVRASALAQQRLLMTLLLGLAFAAVVVAAIGVHGLIATTVTERTREMGIRLALGASVTQALRTLALPGIVLVMIGTVAGLLGALAAAPLLRHFVWGVRLDDPLTLVAVAGLLLSVGVVASVLPARRILRLDPATTLRQD